MDRSAPALVVAAALLAGLPWVAAAQATGPAPAARTQAPPLTVTTPGGAPAVAVGGVLADEALEEAARSGLPLRMRFRVELWRDELFDDLVQQDAWTAVLAYEPLERRFLAGTDSLAAFADYGPARAALERVYLPALTPVRPGRYYYLAFLEIETLSLSDLDELEQWLRGELEPAVRGRRSVPGALGSGLKRVLIRVLDLPARRYQARSAPFRVR